MAERVLGVRFSVWERDGLLQLDIGDGQGGYRLFGPKFAGDSRRVATSRPLTSRDINEIRRYLDKAEQEV